MRVLECLLSCSFRPTVTLLFVFDIAGTSVLATALKKVHVHIYRF